MMLEEEDRRDPLLPEAKRLAEQSRVSTSLLQRRLRVGYVRAARLIELLREDSVLEDEDDVDAGDEDDH